MKITTLKNKITLIVLFLFLVSGFLYRYSPRRIEFIGYYDKVLAHRVNSVEKLNSSLNYFKGVELDLEYNKTNNSLDVNHPPAKSINLNFETYINQIKEGVFPILWLDIKGLKLDNANAIFFKLNTIFEKRNYPKQKILIETLHPEALSIFTASGYKTSYYLPRELHLKEGGDLLKEINKIKTILKSQPFIGISSSFEDYSVLKQYFPEKTKYLWAITSPYHIKYKEIRTVLKDQKVEIVLTNYRSFFGNR